MWKPTLSAFIQSDVIDKDKVAGYKTTLDTAKAKLDEEWVLRSAYYSGTSDAEIKNILKRYYNDLKKVESAAQTFCNSFKGAAEKRVCFHR